jgi:hypothetical protein
MRDRWLITGAVMGMALLLPVPGSAQDLTMPPSMYQNPTMPMPDSEPPAASPAAPASPQTQPAEQPATVAQEKKPAKIGAAKAKPAAQAAETTSAGKSRGALKSKMARSGARTPRDMVAAIYRFSAGKDGNYGGPSAFDDARIRQLYFSKDLIAALAATRAKSTGDAAINFDPITNSEGPDVEDLKIALESEKADRASVAARFTSAEDSSIVHYDFVKEGGAWKLDNIRGEIEGQDGQWSLRDILKNSLQRS